MQRRRFLAMLGGVAVLPLPLRAQQAHSVIGFLHSADSQSFASQFAAFHDGLREGGYEEGRNVAIEYRWAEGKFDRLPAMAADLVAECRRSSCGWRQRFESGRPRRDLHHPDRV
jgi:putative ABC transport system substrate-binding protein